MLLGHSAPLLPRLALCLSLLAADTGFAQGSEAPPSAPSEESPEQPAPHGEVFPREQESGGAGAARFAGRLLLQPVAGVLAGGVAGTVVFFPAFYLAFLGCALVIDDISTGCLEAITFPAVIASAAVGAGAGVLGAGYLLGGKARVSAVLAGGLAGAAIGGAFMLLSREKDYGRITLISLGASTLGAMLVYVLSDAFFPEPTRPIAPTRKEEEVDEYAWVLPMVSATRTGGIIGGLAGRF